MAGAPGHVVPSARDEMPRQNNPELFTKLWEMMSNLQIKQENNEQMETPSEILRRTGLVVLKIDKSFIEAAKGDLLLLPTSRRDGRQIILTLSLSPAGKEIRKYVDEVSQKLV
jgi:hypothetical protein